MISKVEPIGSLRSLDHILIDSDLYLKPNFLISLRHIFVITYFREICLIKIHIFTYLFNFHLFVHTHTRMYLKPILRLNLTLYQEQKVLKLKKTYF